MLEISLLPINPARKSVHKVTHPKTVLYDSTLKLIETCTAWAKNTLKRMGAFELWFKNENFCFIQ